MLVGTSDTAPRVGSGRIAVLATPVMITLMEEAALDATDRFLPEGKHSLGTRVDVSHIAATPTGMKVTAEAALVKVEGRKLLFNVRISDEKELIGEGRHERVIVTADLFERRISEKANG
jgi:predicted thioesterase